MRRADQVMVHKLGIRTEQPPWPELTPAGCVSMVVGNLFKTAADPGSLPIRFPSPPAVGVPGD